MNDEMSNALDAAFKSTNEALATAREQLKHYEYLQRADKNTIDSLGRMISAHMFIRNDSGDVERYRKLTGYAQHKRDTRRKKINNLLTLIVQLKDALTFIYLARAERRQSAS